ncbi:iron repressor protein [Corynebacterium humireducens NBRC 106098 = DSM 45392]|uniref:Diphtheria toxin repressor n=1 Tax=Corynebacterium humireducens NBRC 106098 = DSM 45392 TaxID=1223515 RepID=A0A0B5D5H0_9CORY|nr:metal-dependent transcriptional regulator [Corynebacterium humireducens]AJE32322.1 iron repressor protein [Corynebacterium humireducens NBRC 106098 = DSM 45392]
MHVHDLPDRSQDYLKALWDIAELSDAPGTPAALGDLARLTGQKLPTASEAVKRLARQGLVHHEPYAGVTLTAEGRRLALAMVRRHRLLETFLVTVLGYTWDEVHEDADLLEHGVSDRLLERMDAHLGHPARDPHGDPIPTADGSVEKLPGLSLTAVAPGTEVLVEQINDRDPDLLRYLAGHGIVPGAHLRVDAAPAAGLLTVTVAGVPVPVAESSLGDIRVSLPGSAE